MEEFYQYTGPDHSVLLEKDKLYVYSTPFERAIDRCGELRAFTYFACSELIYYEDQIWMKIRRNLFSTSSSHNANGYIRVSFDFDTMIAPKQRQSTGFYDTPQLFKHLIQLPSFPSFFCARKNVTLSRIPVFSSDKTSPFTSIQRQLPPISIFQATEARFNDDFSQLALHITSPFGMKGWITTSFYHDLIPIHDPRRSQSQPFYIQNIAPPDGKWKGELPIRHQPTLQAPRIEYLHQFQIVRAVERKLVKDQIWIQLMNPSESEEMWVIERHANTGEPVIALWGREGIENGIDEVERYYRNIYSQRVLPVRKGPSIEEEIIGELVPGTVLISTFRVLNEQGQMWIRIAMKDVRSTDSNSNLEYGYAIQSSSKTNVCMLQEISRPGKLTRQHCFQVVLSSEEDVVAVHSEPSLKSKLLCSIRNGTVFHAIGSVFNAEQQSMWLQVLWDDLDPKMTSMLTSEINSMVVYVPLARGPKNVVIALGRELQKTRNPSHVEAEQARTGGARVVFQGRASKLFGPHLLSTINLSKSKDSSESTAARAAGEDNPKIKAFALTAASQVFEDGTTIQNRRNMICTALFSALERSFKPCFEGKTSKYTSLNQFDEDDEDEEYGVRNVH